MSITFRSRTQNIPMVSFITFGVSERAGNSRRSRSIRRCRAVKEAVPCAGVLAPPKVEAQETESLSDQQITEVLVRLERHALYLIIVVALGTGMRRGEQCGLQWRDVDL